MTEKTIKPKRMTREQIRKGLDSVPMDTLILGMGARHAGETLSAKDREFARMVALGESQVGAYRKSRDTKGNKNTQRVSAHRVAQKPNVQLMIETFAEAKRFTDSHTPEQMRAFVIQQLTLHAQNEDFPPAQRLKALELIGKHSGVDSFVNRSEVVHIKQSGDIKSRIIEKLRLIGASSTTLANAEQDDEQDADSLLHELNDPIPDENAPDDTHGTHPPPELGVEVSDDTHTIPYNRISADPMSSDKSDTDVVFDAIVSHSSDEPTQPKEDRRDSHL